MRWRAELLPCKSNSTKRKHPVADAFFVLATYKEASHDVELLSPMRARLETELFLLWNGVEGVVTNADGTDFVLRKGTLVRWPRTKFQFMTARQFGEKFEVVVRHPLTYQKLSPDDGALYRRLSALRVGIQQMSAV